MAASNWFISLRARSLIRCSIVPKPVVYVLAETERVPKSASCTSNLPKAAEPPSSSSLERRNSFIHTSVFTEAVLPSLGFSMPIKKLLTSPKLGFPKTE